MRRNTSLNPMLPIVDGHYQLSDGRSIAVEGCLCGPFYSPYCPVDLHRELFKREREESGLFASQMRLSDAQKEKD